MKTRSVNQEWTILEIHMILSSSLGTTLDLREKVRKHVFNFHRWQIHLLLSLLQAVNAFDSCLELRVILILRPMAYRGQELFANFRKTRLLLVYVIARILLLYTRFA